MATKPKREPTPPDGAPKPRRQNGGRSRVGEVDDPKITGDSARPVRREADEAPVDESGQVGRQPSQVDLLH